MLSSVNVTPLGDPSNGQRNPYALYTNTRYIKLRVDKAHTAPGLSTPAIALGVCRLRQSTSPLACGRKVATLRPPQARRKLAVFASALVPQHRRYGSPGNKPQAWQVVSAVCAVAMLLCNFHRSVFTALLPLLSGGLGLSPAEVGLLQSAMLWGYLAGQLPAGKLADEQGGHRILLGGLALWSIATGATAAAAAATSTTAALVTLLVARVAMGLFSSVIMPAVSAATAQWVPAERKAATLAMIYAFFNVGGVLGLIAAPHMAARSGWPSAFITAAAGGVMWAALGTAAVARTTGAQPLRRSPPPASLLTPSQPQTSLPQTPPAEVTKKSDTEAPSSGTMSRLSPGAGPVSGNGDPRVVGAAGAAAPASSGDRSSNRSSSLLQVAVLCWCHGVIGWGFFVLQAWVPLYLQSLGVTDLASAGLLASLPWLAAAFTATAAGGLADRLVRSGRATRLAVRQGMHAVSTLGCAAAVLPLAAAPTTAAAGSLPPLVATLCLVAAVGCYGFSFGGFHAYVQDVAAADAGKLLGLTNTASILGGIAGNLATGWLLQTTGSYGGVFWVAAALYASSWLCFMGLLRGEPVSLAGLGLRTTRAEGVGKERGKG